MSRIFNMLVTVIGCAVFSVQANADDNAIDISNLAYQCWTAPSAVEHEEMTAYFTIELDDNGSIIDISSLMKKPAEPIEKVFILSASRAIQRCAPYSNLRAGKQLIEFNTPRQKKYIDPFK